METLGLLLGRGADINEKCAVHERHMSGGFTALHLAAGAGRPDVVAFLLEKGADITLADAQGRSALDYARRTLDQPFFRDKRAEKWAEVYRETKAEAHRETVVLLQKETNPCPNH